ncbi:tyrosine-type recombinase/integrase [Cupriavidus sp. IDO]|uniref:tyrosine-type recombinase/integrase n=1 Tax=Cupriavidus sp. IDO TaxID=1539142 RepID=UPI0005794DC9|nr:tyrosine-type recombinase/integrase [Cupriavidus sp. IDO]KWR91136.1 integrase [Cupriavidus sp. IDO]
MSASTSLQARVEQFLVERHRLGFSTRDDGYALRSFARHVHATGHRGALTVELMADWARSDRHNSSDSRTWARRLKKLRTFLRWLQQFEPRTEVPDDTIFGRLPERQAPHIFSEQEIVDLLACARRLGPASGLRGAVYETLFGLIAATGLRIGEALSLRNGDINLKNGMLTIGRTKFGKSRQVPMHPSTVDALRRYRRQRDLAEGFPAEEGPFFVGTRGRRRGLPLSDRQVQRVFRDLQQQLGCVNRGAHDAPRIHDLRHTFVVRRIVQWQAHGVDIDQAMLSLSTYVGHMLVTNTYWYLSAVPELMALAAGRFESFATKREVQDA